MSHWPFILGSYAASVGATLALTLWSWAAMRRAEAEAQRLGRDA